MYGTHGDRARGPGHCSEELRHRGQKPVACRSGHRRPHEPLDNRGIFGVKGVQLGVGLPFLTQQLPWPSPCLCPADHREGRSFGWPVGQERAEALRLRVPAEHEPQTPGASIALPAHPQLDPLTFGPRSVDGLERLVAQ